MRSALRSDRSTSSTAPRTALRKYSRTRLSGVCSTTSVTISLGSALGLASATERISSRSFIGLLSAGARRRRTDLGYSRPGWPSPGGLTGDSGFEMDIAGCLAVSSGSWCSRLEVGGVADDPGILPTPVVHDVALELGLRQLDRVVPRPA